MPGRALPSELWTSSSLGAIRYRARPCKTSARDGVNAWCTQPFALPVLLLSQKQAGGQQKGSPAATNASTEARPGPPGKYVVRSCTGFLLWVSFSSLTCRRTKRRAHRSSGRRRRWGLYHLYEPDVPALTARAGGHVLLQRRPGPGRECLGGQTLLEGGDK